MRYLAVLSCSIAVFFCPLTVTRAETGCLLCGVAGFAIGAGTSQGEAGMTAGAGVIYVAPHISERIADPLAVRMVASDTFSYTVDGHWTSLTSLAGKTLRQIFAVSVKDPEKYTILEVVQVLIPNDVRTAVFWFAYIETEKLRPLSESHKQ